MRKLTTILTTIILLTLASGCGHSKKDRAISGGGIGAGVGAVGGAIIGGNPAVGAAIGGAAGAAAGGLTDKKDLYLGKPIWK